MFELELIHITQANNPTCFWFYLAVVYEYFRLDINN